VRAAHSVAAGKVDSGGRTATQNLDVEAILYTRLIRNGAFCNLRVEMVRNRDSTHLQSWHYSGTVAQLSSIREQMEADVFNYWRGGAAARRGEIGGTADPVAYELYLRARYHTQQRDPNAMLEAQKEYREAINRDPGFAKAYSGLALAMFISSDARADQDQAERLALKAARLAPNLADAHAVLGNLYFLDDWRFKEGVRELRRAIALDPSEPSYRVWLALSVGNLGRFQEALSQIDVAEADDPYWPEIYQNEVVLGMDSHQPARMTAASDMLLRIKPESPSSYDARARVDWVLGRYAKAIADWRQVGVIEEDPARIALEDRGLEALRKSGPRAYARLRLDSLLRNRNSDASTDGFIAAEWYAYAGDREGCLQELTRLVDLRSEDAIDILVNPAYAPLHQDLRFQKLAAKLGLSAAGEEPETRAELNPPAKGGEARTADAPVLSLKTGFSDLPAGTPYP
jgi:tetratricopeptide (TPR) repeat protein